MNKLRIFLLVVIVLLLAGCSMGGENMKLDRDHRATREVIDQLLEAIQSKDAMTVKSLFSQNSLQATESFDSSLTELFDYFHGTVQSYDDGAGPYVETSREGGLVIRIMESSFDVVTSEDIYRFAIRYTDKNSVNTKEEGISSLYVIRMEDDSYPQYMYWGDGEFTAGIHVAVPNAE